MRENKIGQLVLNDGKLWIGEPGKHGQVEDYAPMIIDVTIGTWNFELKYNKDGLIYEVLLWHEKTSKPEFNGHWTYGYPNFGSLKIEYKGQKIRVDPRIGIDCATIGFADPDRIADLPIIDHTIADHTLIDDALVVNTLGDANATFCVRYGDTGLVDAISFDPSVGIENQDWEDWNKRPEPAST